MAAQGTPLCPAGHLPRKGGDWRFARRLSSSDVGDWRKPACHLPLAGEMAGRPEGGVTERDLPHLRRVPSHRLATSLATACASMPISRNNPVTGL